MNFYKRHIGDYIKDTAHLSLLEHGVYTRLLDVYYTRESGIPDDQAARLIGARTKEEKSALRSVLEEFFVLSDDRVWRNNRCDEEIIEAAEFGEEREAKVENEKERQRRHREERRKLFLELRSHDIIPAWDTRMDTLRELLRNVTKTDLSRVTGVTVTRTATAIHKPQAISQNKDPQTPEPVTPETPKLNGAHAAPPGDVERVFDHWREVWKHPGAQLDDKRRKLIRAALKGYTVEQLCTSISGYQHSPHHRGDNDRKTVYDALTLLLRDNDHIDAGLKFAANGAQQQWM